MPSSEWTGHIGQRDSHRVLGLAFVGLEVDEESWRGGIMGLMFVKGEVGFQKGLHEFGELSDIDLTGRAIEVWLGRLFSVV